MTEILVLCRLSYGTAEANPMGLEPTTTRLQVEVTVLYTTPNLHNYNSGRGTSDNRVLYALYH